MAMRKRAANSSWQMVRLSLDSFDVCVLSLCHTCCSRDDDDDGDGEEEEEDHGCCSTSLLLPHAAS